MWVLVVLLTQKEFCSYWWHRLSCQRSGYTDQYYGLLLWPLRQKKNHIPAEVQLAPSIVWFQPSRLFAFTCKDNVRTACPDVALHRRPHKTKVAFVTVVLLSQELSAIHRYELQIWAVWWSRTRDDRILLKWIRKTYDKGMQTEFVWSRKRHRDMLVYTQ